MAAITPSTVYRESLGSLTLVVANFASQSTSDTWTTEAGIPVFSYWAQSTAGQGYNEPDISFAQSTGIFTFVSGTQVGAAFVLYMLMRT